MASIIASAHASSDYETRVSQNIFDDAEVHQKIRAEVALMQWEKMVARPVLALDECNPVNYVDPDGLAKVKVGGEIWETPSVSDAGHVHTGPDGLDQGPHLHGPNGKKYFPQTGRVLDKNGKWTGVGKKQMKKMNSAISKIRGGGIVGILLILASYADDANACEQVQQIKDELARFKAAQENGETDLLAATGIAQGLQNLTGEGISTNIILGELIK